MYVEHCLPVSFVLSFLSFLCCFLHALHHLVTGQGKAVRATTSRKDSLFCVDINRVRPIIDLGEVKTARSVEICAHCHELGRSHAINEFTKNEVSPAAGLTPPDRVIRNPGTEWTVPKARGPARLRRPLVSIERTN